MDKKDEFNLDEFKDLLNDVPDAGDFDLESIIAEVEGRAPAEPKAEPVRSEPVHSEPAPAAAEPAREQPPVKTAPKTKSKAAPAAPAAAPAVAADGQKVLSPMPGTMLSVNVSVGSAVKAGEVILILEAMKMENEIVAPCDGTVKQLAVQKGSTVATDVLLAVVG